jgi:hypothetical protein
LILRGADWEPADPTVQGSDPDGDGVWTLTVTLPGGDYEFKVAIDGTWEENYGAGGQLDGANIGFTVPGEGGDAVFYYDRATGEINLGVNAPSGPVPAPQTFRRRRRDLPAGIAPRQPQRSLPHTLWRPADRHQRDAAAAHRRQRCRAGDAGVGQRERRRHPLRTAASRRRR